MKTRHIHKTCLAVSESMTRAGVTLFAVLPQVIASLRRKTSMPPGILSVMIAAATLGLTATRAEFAAQPITQDSAVLIKADCASGTLIIPERIEGRKIVRIAGSALSLCPDITAIVIPSTVGIIERGAFDGCIGLQSFTVDALNRSYASEDGVLMNHRRTSIVAFPKGRAGTYAVPQGVTRVLEGAFGFCRRLERIELPDSVTRIDDGAFTGCSALRQVSLGSCVEEIGGTAFSYCPLLSRITIPASTIWIGDGAFYDDSKDMAVYFEGHAPAMRSLFGGFASQANPTVWYMPDTSGYFPPWGTNPPSVWLPELVPTVRSTPEPTAPGFTFAIRWGRARSVTVETRDDVAHGAWTPLESLPLTELPTPFIDTNSSGHSTRLYRAHAHLPSPDTPPLILVQPRSQSVIEGGTVHWRVSAVSALPIQYRWHAFGQPIQEFSTNAVLVLTNITAGSAADYTVVVSNSAGVVTSAVARLTVDTGPWGTVLFSTRAGASVNAPVTYSGDNSLADGRFLGQLYGGPDGESMVPLGTPVPFRSDAGKGYITAGGAVEVLGVHPGEQAWVKMVAWAAALGTTYESAMWSGAVGESPPITVQMNADPAVPAPLAGLSGFTIWAWLGQPFPGSLAEEVPW